MNQIEYQARPHQFRALKAAEKYVVLFGGVGSGKTEVGSLLTLRKIKENPGSVKGLIAANTYTQLIDSTITNAYRKWKSLGVRILPTEPPRSYGPFNIRIWCGRAWHEVRCRSLDNYEMLAGAEYGWAWLDEVYMTKEAAWNEVQARLRDTEAGRIQALLTTTTDEPSSWLYKVFVDDVDEALMKVIYATSYDNEKNLPPGYIDELKGTYSDRLFDRKGLAKWVSLTGSMIYSAFDRKVHVAGGEHSGCRPEDVDFDPALPILWSLDFNIGEGKPMSSALGQIRKSSGPDGRVRPEINWFDEIVIDSSDTNDAIDEFKAKPWWGRKPRPRVIVYGDAAGRARDTRSKVTDYILLSRAGFRAQNVPPSNPSVRDRHNLVNSLLKAANGDVRMKIHPRCKTLIKGFETTKLKKGANYLEDDRVREQHVTTAAGYMICREFSLTVPRGDGPKHWK